MLPMVPELTQMLEHPLIDGALQSILGTDYYVHLHRHVHNRPNIDEGEPGAVQRLHKDSLGNSRFCVDNKRRQHRCRMCMLVYFPQDTPLEWGPTGVMPRSQYLLHQPQPKENTVPYQERAAVPLAGPAGTVAIVHYDLLHCSTNKIVDSTRHMVKFLFSRMTEPEVSGPTWDSSGSAWEPTDDLQDPVQRAQWDWHCGRPDQPSWDASLEAAPAALAEQLRSTNELEAVRAAYTLGIGSAEEEGVPVLVEALSELSADETLDPLDLEPQMNNIRQDFHHAEASTQAGYGLTEAGAAAVPALLELAASETPLLRSRAIDVLGDIGPAAAPALPKLLEAMQDTHVDPRRRAVEAIGTVGCGHSEQAQLCVALAEVLRDDPHEQVKRNAAYSLARLGPALRDGACEQEPAVISALVDGLTDPYHYVRGFSALALEKIGTPAALGAALSHLQTMRFD